MSEILDTDSDGKPGRTVDSTSYPIWDAQYLPFGDLENKNSSIGIEVGDVSGNGITWEPPFRFPGQYFDYNELGAYYNMFYNQYRFYIPGIARYSSADLSLEGLRYSYLYSSNNPLLFIDPTGLECAKICDDQVGKYCDWYDVEVGDIVAYDVSGGHVALVFGFSGDTIQVAENIGTGPRVPSQKPYAGRPDSICARPNFPDAKTDNTIRYYMSNSGITGYTNEPQPASSPNQDCAGYVSRVYELMGRKDMRDGKYYLNHEQLIGRYCGGYGKRKKCCK